MTKAQKRVAIAKDVIKQIAARNFRPKGGIYVSLAKPEAGMGDYETTADKAFFNARKRKPCVVCAKGAMVCSTIRLFNKFSDSIAALEPSVENVLRRNFGKRMGDMIECAFEQWDFDGYDGHENNHILGKDAVNRSYAFGLKYRSNTKRIIAIMRNIIANKGTFKP